MILCRNCNVNISDDAIYCPYCGCIIRSTPNSGNFYNQTINGRVSTIQKNNKLLLKLIAFFLILIVIAFLFVINVHIDTFYKNLRTPGVNDLTLEKVIELSEKGQGLSWSDFDNFVCEEERYNKITGEQSRKYKSHFTYTFSILISGQRGSQCPSASSHVCRLSPCSPVPNVPAEQRGVHRSYFCCLQNIKEILTPFSDIFFFLS